MEYNLIDFNFAHDNFSSQQQNSKLITWNRNRTSKNQTFITDNSLYNNHNIPNKIAWLLEPKTINPEIYEYIKKNSHVYDMVITFDKELLDLGDKYKKYIFGGCWIKESDRRIYNKTKNISIIASNKNITEGHNFRHHVISNLGHKMDLYGNGYNPISNKVTALSDYRFSIVIENGNFDYYITEKLIDCLVTGTIPIYWGCPSIADFFNINGIIKFENLQQLIEIIDTLTPELYLSKLDAVKENYELAKNYLVAEDYIAKNILNIHESN